MEKYRQKLGKLGESLAGKFLQAKGYEILDKNIYFRCGEIDILAKIKEKIVFIEVKTRTNNKYGYPEEALTRKKMIKMNEAINNYLLNYPEITDWQVDCLSINYDAVTRKAKIYHLKNIDFTGIE